MSDEKKSLADKIVGSIDGLGIAHSDDEMRACLMQAYRLAGRRTAVAPCHVATAIDCTWNEASLYLANAERRGFCTLRLNGQYTLMAKCARPNAVRN